MTFILWLIKGCCYGNQFWGKLAKISLLHLHSSHWHFKMDWSIATLTCCWQKSTVSPFSSLSFITSKPGWLYAGLCCIGAESIGHGWARAHPLFVSGGHKGGHSQSTSSTETWSSFTEYQKENKNLAVDITLGCKLESFYHKYLLFYCYNFISTPHLHRPPCWISKFLNFWSTVRLEA